MSDLKISFKKSTEPLIKVQPQKENIENEVSKMSKVDLLMQDASTVCNAKDIYKYLTQFFKEVYPQVPYIESVPQQRVYKAINNRSQQVGSKQTFVKLAKFFISNYSTKYATEKYPYPRISQLEVNWIFDTVYTHYMSFESLSQVNQQQSSTQKATIEEEEFNFY